MTINTAEIEARLADHYSMGTSVGHSPSSQIMTDIRNLLAALKAGTARADRYAERLEITSHWVSYDDGATLTRVEVPREDWDKQIDGIDCRDETIKLQDAAVDNLRDQLTAANEKLAAAGELVRKLGDPLLEICDHLEDEDDRVYLGSTNHADTLKDAQQSYWAWWLQEEIDAGRLDTQHTTGDGNGR